jgi:hypothetical protein
MRRKSIAVIARECLNISISLDVLRCLVEGMKINRLLIINEKINYFQRGIVMVS